MKLTDPSIDEIFERWFGESIECMENEDMIRKGLYEPLVELFLNNKRHADRYEVVRTKLRVENADTVAGINKAFLTTAFGKNGLSPMKYLPGPEGVDQALDELIRTRDDGTGKNMEGKTGR